MGDVPLAIDRATNVYIIMYGERHRAGLATKTRLVIDLSIDCDSLKLKGDLGALNAAFALRMRHTRARAVEAIEKRVMLHYEL